jgi:hypothetical protein
VRVEDSAEGWGEECTKVGKAQYLYGETVSVLSVQFFFLAYRSKRLPDTLGTDFAITYCEPDCPDDSGAEPLQGSC